MQEIQSSHLILISSTFTQRRALLISAFVHSTEHSKNQVNWEEHYNYSAGNYFNAWITYLAKISTR